MGVCYYVGVRVCWAMIEFARVAAGVWAGSGACHGVGVGVGVGVGLNVRVGVGVDAGA